MHHTITIGGLLASLGLVAGVAVFAVSLLSLMAEGMSDGPVSDGKGGCIVALF